MTNEEIFSCIDHTLLKPTATWQQIQTLCEEAIANKMASVCIPPSYIRRVREAFGDELTICTVIGFPLGYQTTAVKVFETAQALADGADEIDMVINLGYVKDGEYDKVLAEIQAIKRVVGDKILKVIVETCYLAYGEKIRLCELINKSGADFIKTSTGFGTAGANLEDIRLFKEFIEPHVKMKAAGGIRDRGYLDAFLREGCARIGTSSIFDLLKQETDQEN